jgi:ABC-type transport system involved in multi-copper enzyme maturation permease subunit
VLTIALRDLFTARREKLLWLALVLSAIYPIVYKGGPGIGLFLSVFPAYYILSWGLGKEYKYKTDRLFNALPFSRSALVLSRYLGGLMIWLAALVISLPCWIVFSIWGGGAALYLGGVLGLLFSAFCLFSGVYLLGYYLFGFQRASYFFIIVCVLVGVLGGALGSLAPAGQKAGLSEGLALFIGGGAPALIYVAMALGGLLFYAACCGISVIADRKREA